MESSSRRYYHKDDFHSRNHIETYCSTNSIFIKEILTFPMEKLYQVFQKAKLLQKVTKTLTSHVLLMVVLTNHIETYCSTNSILIKEIITFPMEKLHHVFEKDHIQGDLCIDISFGSHIHHLISASGCFKEILLMRATDSCIFEINRWLHDRTGAFCWKHTSSFVAEKQGMSDSCEHKEMQLKNKISHVIKCDLGKENITDPLETPQGDCVITFWLLEAISNTHNEYVRNLRKLLTRLKPGGRLILIGDVNATYYITNGKRFHVLKCDKEFICSALLGEKLIIDQCDFFPKTVESDLCDFDGLIFISARREK